MSACVVVVCGACVCAHVGLRAPVCLGVQACLQAACLRESLCVCVCACACVHGVGDMCVCICVCGVGRSSNATLLFEGHPDMTDTCKSFGGTCQLPRRQPPWRQPPWRRPPPPHRWHLGNALAASFPANAARGWQGWCAAKGWHIACGMYHMTSRAGAWPLACSKSFVFVTVSHMSWYVLHTREPLATQRLGHTHMKH